MALIGHAVLEKKIFENGGRTTDGRTPEHGYTISLPGKPYGLGELKYKAMPFLSGMRTRRCLGQIYHMCDRFIGSSAVLHVSSVYSSGECDSSAPSKICT